jgi:hypothetical protein
LILHHIYKGLNFLDIRNEKDKQENAILNPRIIKQQHYWNNELYKYMVVGQEGGGVILRLRGVDYHQKLWNQTLTFRYYANGKVTKIHTSFLLCL